MADTGKMDLNREVIGKMVDWITFAAINIYFLLHKNSGRLILVSLINLIIFGH